MSRERKPGAIPVGQLLPIGFTVAALIAVIVLKGRCANSVGDLFKVVAPAQVDAGRP